jgi:hypothetical protein
MVMAAGFAVPANQRTAGPTRLAGLLIALGALPPLVVLVTGQSPHYLLGPQATGAAGPAEVAVLLILSIVVIFSPMYVSTWLSWNAAPKSMRKLLPEAIDPETGGDHYPAVLIDKETGDFLLHGGPSPTRTRWRPSLRTAR